MNRNKTILRKDSAKAMLLWLMEKSFHLQCIVRINKTVWRRINKLTWNGW